jgi:predicted acyltransferase
MSTNTAQLLPTGEQRLAEQPPHPAEERVTPRTEAEYAPQRLVSLDVFRGATIAAMLFVNNPGTAKFGYALLQHAEWDGCRPPDFIFPFFLFIVGVSLAYSLAQQQRRGMQRRAMLAKIIRRSVILLGLGLLLNALPYFDWEITRLPGVLQRIALCYFAAAMVVLHTGVRGQAVVATLLLLAYWLLMTGVPVPGHGAGVLQPHTNLAAYIDHSLMGGHLWHHDWDPEGLLGTLPAVSTTLAGVLTGHWLRSAQRASQRLAGLFAAGITALALGLVMNHWFPINKNLWTSSYAVFTAGAALISLGICYWLVDVQGYRRWAKPFVVFGTNAIAAYALSTLMTKGLALWTVTRSDGSPVMLKAYLFQHYFLPLATRREASLLYAFAFVLVWLALMSVLYRKRVFIKV